MRGSLAKLKKEKDGLMWGPEVRRKTVEMGGNVNI